MLTSVDRTSTAPPDLEDFATAGRILELIDEYHVLSDVVRYPDQWIVAVAFGKDLRGYIADSLGEAAAWALLVVWDRVDTLTTGPMAEA
jgi:hypothetical protein